MQMQRITQLLILLFCSGCFFSSHLTYAQDAKIILKEVVIRAPKRYRDTTILNLAQHSFKRSVMITDIFSQQGFSIDEQNRLRYNGKIVSNLQANNNDFFGKNNLVVYSLLPALIIDKIEIIETDIDSITNTTMLNPSIKVNLLLKKQYSNGRFGTAHMGLGSLSRHLLSADVFAYRNKEQISLFILSNNINQADQALPEPRISFSPQGNNITNRVSRITYHNIFGNKIDFTAAVRGKTSINHFQSNSERQEENIGITSKTGNTSLSRYWGLEEAFLHLAYQIDSQYTIKASQSFNLTRTLQRDSTINQISFDHRLSKWDVLKSLRIAQYSSMSGLFLEKRFLSKAGRQFNIDLNYDHSIFTIEDINRIADSTDLLVSAYKMDRNREVSKKASLINLNYTEPLGDEAYLRFGLRLSNNDILFQSVTKNTKSYEQLTYTFRVTNRLLEPNINFYKRLHQFSFSGTWAVIPGLQQIAEGKHLRKNQLLNANTNIRIDYKSGKKSFGWLYTLKSNYPSLEQITNISSSFDPTSQTNGNSLLKPEVKRRLEMIIELRGHEEQNISLSGGIDYYTSKFGMNVEALNTGTQNSFLDNVGNAFAADIQFSRHFSVKGRMMLYRTVMNYQEMPSIILGKSVKSNGVILNQSISTSFHVDKITFAPAYSITLSRFWFDANTSQVINLVYSDKFSYVLKELELHLYPLFTYQKSTKGHFAFATNAEISLNIFKKYGQIWLKMYDLFNSFRYYNNNTTSLYSQTTTYTNLQRYILLGISLKFNNMRSAQ